MDALSTNQSGPAPRSLIRLSAVSARVGLQKTAIYQAIAEGIFPRPVRISTRAVAWPSDEIERWIDARIAASRDEAAV